MIKKILLFTAFIFISGSSKVSATEFAIQKVSSNQDLPTTMASAGNIDCHQQVFLPKLINSPTYQACAVNTPYGYVAGEFARIDGRDGRLRNSSGGTIVLRPAANNYGAVVLESTSIGWKLHYLKYGALSSKYEINKFSLDRYFYVTDQPTITISYKDKPVYVRPESVAYSNSGKWLIVDSPNRAMFRINLESYEVFPFRQPYNYQSGSGPMPHIAINDDGDMVISSSRNNDITVVDLKDCQPPANSLITAYSCRQERFDISLRELIPSFTRAYNTRFVTDSIASFYISSSQPGAKYEKYLLYPSGTTLPKNNYLGLGDSFSSGEGAYQYYPETDKSTNKCHLSVVSYPFLIANHLHISNARSVACSGATTREVLEKVAWPIVPSENTLGDLLPGNRPQIESVVLMRPKIITIGIGGNDAGLNSRLRACLAPGTCYKNYEDRLEILNEIQAQEEKLIRTFSSLKSAAPDAKIFVIGYPSIAYTKGKCSLNVLLNKQELELGNLMIKELNAVISRAAQRAEVIYTDIYSALAGHRFCETTPNKVAMNGLTLGGDKPFSFGPFASESYHPNAIGHQLLKDKIIHQTNAFTRSVSASVSLSNTDKSILDAPASGRDVYKTIYSDDLVANTLARGATLQISLDKKKTFLPVEANIKTFINDQPVEFELLQQNDETVKAELKIGGQIDTGFAVVKIRTVDIFDEKVEYYKAVYVEARPDIKDAPNQKNTLAASTQQSRPKINNPIDLFITNKASIAQPENPVTAIIKSSLSSYRAVIPIFDSSYRRIELLQANHTGLIWIGLSTLIIAAGFLVQYKVWK